MLYIIALVEKSDQYSDGMDFRQHLCLPVRVESMLLRFIILSGPLWMERQNCKI